MSGEEPASKVCYADEGDAAYMGQASREEVAAFLNELIEAERGIADRLSEMLPKIRDDELHAALKSALECLEESIARATAALG